MDKRIRIETQEAHKLFDAIIARGTTTGEIAERLGMSLRTIRDWRRGKYTIPYSHFSSLLDMSGLSPADITAEELPQWWAARGAARKGGRMYMAKYGRLGTAESRRSGGQKSYEMRRAKSDDIFARKVICAPAISPQLAEFVGIMMGDGSIGRYQASVTLDAITDREYLDYVVGLVNTLFALRPFVQERPERGCAVVIMSSIELCDILVSLGLPRGDKLLAGLSIPAWIMKDERYLAMCLRGLFDTDGSIFREIHNVKDKSYTYLRLMFASASSLLCKEVADSLNYLGVRALVRGGRRVSVERFTDIEKYFRIIGSSNPKHLGRYAQYGGVG